MFKRSQRSLFIKNDREIVETKRNGCCQFGRNQSTSLMISGYAMLGTWGVKRQRRCFTAPSPPFVPIMYLIASSSCKTVGKICNIWRVLTPSVNSG